MLSCQTGNVWAPRNGSAHILVLVCCHGNTIGRATNQDAKTPFCLNGLRQRMSMIWIVYTRSVLNTVINYIMSIFL